MKTKVLLCALAITVLMGCQPATKNIDIANDEGKAVMGLDYRDFDQAATAMISSLVRSGTLNKKDGGRYVMATGRIVNDTMQRIDTDQLMAKVEQEMMNSGQVVMTSAVGDKAGDSLVYEVRDLRDSDKADEFDESTMQAKRTLIAPELSISGKIIQRDVKYNKKTTQVEYYFQLRITDLTTGLRFWQEEKILGKRGSSKTVSW
ncbi:MAG: penicillin-binding protein activator LpoB [Planctomycetales bacterium 4572_13]|nr:MAG: penicillin-binding protein activator LpoB [Planctomycetales bacterium 4572_13]